MNHGITIKIKPNIVWAICCALILLANAKNAAADINADAETALNWAETNFSSILSPSQSTQSTPGWLYRYYSKSDVYVGVNLNDSKQYYIIGKDLRQGVKPTLYVSVANLLRTIKGINEMQLSGSYKDNPSVTVAHALTFVSLEACNAEVIPADAGHSFTHSGNRYKLTTNGCIPKPKKSFGSYGCPRSGGDKFSVMTTRTGDSDFANGLFTMCIADVAESSENRILDVDVCYIEKDNASHAQKFTQTMEDVADCFKTGAYSIVDSKAQWIKSASGEYINSYTGEKHTN
ncbi:MAG: hypothetical protein NTV00_01350 [Methylococcales bacterium]|nr:hypothetical protein [Methylococcales bacterium]